VSERDDAALALDGESLRLEDVADVARKNRPVTLSDSALARVAECRAW